MNHRNVRIVAQHLLSDNWYLLKKSTSNCNAATAAGRR